MEKEKFFNIIKGNLIVSCQAQPNEPLYEKDFSLMPYMAKAAVLAGAVAIRAEGVRDILAIKKVVDVPIIGLIKKEYTHLCQYITPTMEEVDKLATIGVDVIALDATLRGDTINLFYLEIRKKYPNILLIADIATYEDAINADNLGFDLIGTTLNGYTEESKKVNISNYELISKLKDKLKNAKIIAEGKIHSPEDLKLAFSSGAYSAVVGGAITRPKEIAQRFIDAIKQ